MEDFDRQVLGESAGARVRQIDPPDVATSSAEGVPEGYVRSDEPQVGQGHELDEAAEAEAAVELARAAELVVAADEVAKAAEVYSEAMRNAFLRLPNRARPYEEHIALQGALVAYHRARVNGS